MEGDFGLHRLIKAYGRFLRYAACFLTIIVLVVIVLPISWAQADSPPQFSTLQPGGDLWINHNVPVNIVFIGFDEGPEPWEIDRTLFAQIMPEYSVPFDLSPRWSRLIPEGYYLEYAITYLYDHEVTFADDDFTNTFFSYLSSISVPKPLTDYQDQYNAQQARSLTIDWNHWICAPSVERWLAQNAEPMLGIDTSQYTVFFINWYGRDDFKFHVYVKDGPPDPDTGSNFWLEKDEQRLIAWGGTADLGLPDTHRIWFYDISAGPDAISDNWNIDDYEMPNWPDGIMDYRIPPIWEYGNISGYRPFNSVTYDLGLITRLVAINLLFTSSSTHFVLLPDQDLFPAEIEIDHNVFDFGSPFDAEDLIDPELVISSLEKLQPYNDFTYEMNSHDPPARLRKICDTVFEEYRSSYGHRDPLSEPLMDLWCYFRDHRHQYVEGSPDYEMLAVTFLLPDGLYEKYYVPYGWAPGSLADYPAQEFTLVVLSPSTVEQTGGGLTSVAVHEIGHHLGATHPHNGIDLEWGLIYDPYSYLNFVWVGGESNTVMSYSTPGSTDFSQFDIDNMNRWVTSEMLWQCNLMLDDILKSPHVSKVGDLLMQADQNAAMALNYFNSMQYDAAVEHANICFRQVSSAGETINVLPFAGDVPGRWGTPSYDRSPFLRQWLRSMGWSPNPISLDPENLPERLSLEEFLASMEQ